MTWRQGDRSHQRPSAGSGGDLVLWGGVALPLSILFAHFLLHLVSNRLAIAFLAGGLTVSFLLGIALPVAHQLKRSEQERLELEAQFLRAQKMEALARLAGSVAHDFNSLLSVIMGTADLAGDHLHEQEQVNSDLQEIRRAAEQGAGLTRRLLAFSARQAGAPVATDINEIVREHEKMLHRLMGENVSLRLALDVDLPEFFVDRTLLEQVLMNLTINARDAMPNGGSLLIQTARETCSPRAKLEGGTVDWVRLVISDTGVGMDAATLDHIFDPFFTTKEEGCGTGLGLSTVYGIVQQLEGRIQVDSQVGAGSTFTVVLPAPGRSADVRSRPADTGRIRSDYGPEQDALEVTARGSNA
jgi:two-component system, cell cycle sensor histidine kinase and response regulator CckA